MTLFKRVRLLHRKHKSSRKTQSTFTEIILPVTHRIRVFAFPEDREAQEEANNEKIYRELPDHLLQTRSFLQLAALNGDQEAVRTLISQGESVNAVNTVDAVNGRQGEPWYRNHPLTALHAAVEGGHNEIVDYLLTSGSDPNSNMEFWGTPLIIAVRKHNTEIADTLLRRGADVNQLAGYHTADPLQRASYEGNLPMVDLLLEYGANVNGRTAVCGFGPAIVAAAASDNARVIERLVDEGADINAVQCYSRGQLHEMRQNALGRAITWGRVQAVDMLLRRGADMHMECEYGNAVQSAAYFGWEEIFDDLIARGADPYQPTESFANVLEAAVAGGQGLMFQKLLALGMDIHFDCTVAGTLLHVAVMSGEDSIVGYLLDWLDVNQEGGVFGTALIAAASRGNTSTCQLLIARGADLLFQDVHGCPMHHAVEYNNVKTVNLLLDAGTPIDTVGGKIGTALQFAAMGNSEEAVHLLLDRGADVNTQSGYYGNALQAWSYTGNQEIVQHLLDKGADPLALGGFYGTALIAALHRGHESIVQLLIKYGADVEPRTSAFGTALEYATSLKERSIHHEEQEVYARVIQNLSKFECSIETPFSQR